MITWRRHRDRGEGRRPTPGAAPAGAMFAVAHSSAAALRRGVAGVGARWLIWAAAVAACLPRHTAQAAAPAQAQMHIEVALHDIRDDRREPLERIVRSAEADVTNALRAQLRGHLRVDFAGSDEAFRRIVAEAGAGSRWSEPWISGLALLDQDRVIIRLDGPGLLHTSETVRHELAHVAVHALSHGRHLPRWYHEAVAMVVAGEATADRLREGAGPGPAGAIDTLDALQARFDGHRVDASRAYATAAGFVRFALRRSANPTALAELHERLHLGLDFSPAWVATFGLTPSDSYAVYVAMSESAGSRWAVLLGDETVWSVVSLLFLLSLILGWRRRPGISRDSSLDLRAIAAAGDVARRTGLLVPPLEELGPGGLPAWEAGLHAGDDGEAAGTPGAQAPATPPRAAHVVRSAPPGRLRRRYEVSAGR